MGGYAGGSRHPRAEPGRHWLSLPSTFPAGGRGVVACLPCRCGALRGRTCFVARLPCLWVDFLPPSPQPPSPAGKGETYSFLMQGASPLASPHLNPGGTGYPCRLRSRRGAQGGRSPACLVAVVPCGGACLLCRPPTLPLVCLFAPHPPSPLPRRGRGRLIVFLCKGLRPLHPRAELPAALTEPAKQVPCGGLAGCRFGGR